MRNIIIVDPYSTGYNLVEVPTSVAFLIMVLSGIGVLWYIQLLWVFSIVLIAIRKIERDRLWKLGPRTNKLGRMDSLYAE